jgi:hypothetical protein
MLTTTLQPAAATSAGATSPAVRPPEPPTAPFPPQPPDLWPGPAGGSLSRAQALRWWQAGFQAGSDARLAACAHEHDYQAAAEYWAAVAQYRAERAADQAARRDALLLEVIDVLARAMMGSECRSDQAA